MTDEAPLTRQQLEQLRPLSHLAGYGVLDAEGDVRDDLTGALTSAACVQFEAAEVAPQEVLTVCEALRQSSEIVEAASPLEHFKETVDTAFDATAGLLRKDVHPALHHWIHEWQPFVDSPAAFEAFMGHMQSAASLYALVVGRKTR